MRYAEHVYPAVWIWSCLGLLAAGIGISLWPLGTVAAGGTALGTLLVGAAWLLRTTPRLEVGGGRLRAGRARIPVALTGDVDVLDAAAMRRAHGPELDARAYLCLRGWVRGGVRVALTDPDDPTPYWLISSRRPHRLAQALGAEQAEPS